MTWTEAIITVLQQNKHNGEYTPMHYSDITDAIIENNLKDSLGKTPKNTVNAHLSTRREWFTSCGAGYYGLTDRGKKYQIATLASKSSESEKDESSDASIIKEIEIAEKSKIIKAFGMYWSRDNIYWDKSLPSMLGQQSSGSDEIDFSDMRGIYLLYDSREVIYVGQAINQPVIKRLYDHTRDRLSGRWNRFSWFGIDGIDFKSGAIIKTPSPLHIDIANALEGIMIEGLEPRQNRKQGNLFGEEFLQVIDKEVLKKRIDSYIKKLTK